MTKRRGHGSHPDKAGYRERDTSGRDPTQKLYSCFPSNFVWFHFGDNDFSWALHHGTRLAIERLTWSGANYTNRIEFVQSAVTIAFRAMLQVQGIHPDCIYNYDHVVRGALVKVAYIDHMDTSQDNGDTVYLDCWSGEFYGC